MGFRLDLVAAVTLMVAAYMAMALRNKVCCVPVHFVRLALIHALQQNEPTAHCGSLRRVLNWLLHTAQCVTETEGTATRNAL